MRKNEMNRIMVDISFMTFHKNNPKLWQEAQEELVLWEITLKDGLDDT